MGQCEENTYLEKYGWLFTEEKADIMGKKEYKRNVENVGGYILKVYRRLEGVRRGSQ